MNPSDLPCARELFAQWQRARGGRTEAAARPFSRRWEDLLEDARLISAIERGEAERDARSLAVAGWIELHPVRYKAYLIDRISIPLSMESRWCEAFGFVPPTDEEARSIREFPWQPELAFLRETRLNLSFGELQQLNSFIESREQNLPLIPIKERSLQIFGNEKRLDTLLSSALFRFDRLNLARDLRCEIVGVPLAWKRGPSSASAGPIIVIENAATWHSYCRWNAERPQFSAVIYGDGNRFVDGTRYLKDIFAELGGMRPILYFGDLDPQGVLIPQEASGRAQSMDLPAVLPHAWSYRELFRLGAGKAQCWPVEPTSPTLCDWLGESASLARELFASGKRIPQEHLGWEILKNHLF